MTLFIVFIAWLSCLAFVGAVLYVSATYLIYAYDRRLHPNAMHPKLRRIQRWRAVLYEMLATWVCALLYPVGELPRRIKPPKHRSVPILLVHGLNLNQSAWIVLCYRLRQAGFNTTYTLNLKRGNWTIADHVAKVTAAAHDIERVTGISELILIGHSMGGLVATAFNEQQAHPGKVTHVITLGSPLHGTRAAVLGRGGALKDMHYNSALTQKLSRAIEANHTTQYFHIGSWLDNIILPAQSALIGKRPGNERMLIDRGHLTLLYSNQVARQVIEWLQSTVPLAPPHRAHHSTSQVGRKAAKNRAD